MKLLLLLAAAAPIWAQNCTIAVSPSAPISIGAAPAKGTVTVTAGATCTWTWVSDSTWISPYSGSSRGTIDVPWTAGANSQPISRTAVITVSLSGPGSPAGSAQVTIVQDPPPDCKLSLQPSSTALGAPGGAGSFQVQSYCYWTAGSNSNWIGLDGGSGSAVSGAVNYTVASNPCYTARTGSATVRAASLAAAPQTFSVTQDGSPDNLTIDPVGVTLGFAAADGRVSVTSASGCGWSATSSVSWLHVTAGSSGSGQGFVTYHVDENKSGVTRSGTLVLGARTFTVLQQPAPAAVPRVDAALNAASGAGGAVAPGEIVSIYGSGMGPAQGAPVQLTADGLSVTKSLGGAVALFDGVPAALTYASGTQINAVVPYAVAGKTTTQLQVQYQGGTSAAVTLPVQPAASALFTLDQSGSGAGAVLNQDYKVNGALAPAARGSVVMIYCTGAGVTSPASDDASITTSDPAKFPLLTQKVSVTIGGIPAKVTYSGGAPGSVAGLTQINAEIPAGVTPGSAVPVVVQIGDFKSQDRVTIVVK
jgi:uncharacterized protein (TIGR03437 family)